MCSWNPSSPTIYLNGKTVKWTTSGILKHFLSGNKTLIPLPSTSSTCLVSITATPHSSHRWGLTVLAWAVPTPLSFDWELLESFKVCFRGWFFLFFGFEMVFSLYYFVVSVRYTLVNNCHPLFYPVASSY